MSWTTPPCRLTDTISNLPSCFSAACRCIFVVIQTLACVQQLPEPVGEAPKSDSVALRDVKRKSEKHAPQ